MRRAGNLQKTRTVAIAGIDAPRSFPRLQNRFVALCALALDAAAVREMSSRPFVPIEPEPRQIILQRFRVQIFGALPVDVFDAEDNLSAMLPRPEPIPKGDPDISQMEETGGAGRETGADVHYCGSERM